MYLCSKRKEPQLLFLGAAILLSSQVQNEVNAFRLSKVEDTPEHVIEDKSTEEVHEGPGSYWVDISYPITRLKVSDNYPWLPHNVDPENNPTPERYKDMPLQIFGDKQTFYEKMIEGCRKAYDASGCDITERDRTEMNKRQPPSMQNYTDLGFKKIKAPDDVFNLIKSFWEENADKQEPENWFEGNTYTNHWESPTNMVSIENTDLRGGGIFLKNKIWDLAKETLQQWTGQKLTPSSLYGIRVYTEGSVLATHVDRMPLISSAIINVAQDVDEPWPIEVYGHDGRVHNITMEPGDMVLYESHSILHGRPFPLNGRFYANIFIHFEPTGDSLYEDESHAQNDGERDISIPVYVLEDSAEAERWRKKNKKNWKPTEVASVTTGSTNAHSAAQTGNVDVLKAIAMTEQEQLTAKDANGWSPIHEGARAGHTEVLRLLVENGADMNERTNGGSGGSPLYLASSSNGPTHESVKYLQGLGAEYIEPEL